MRTLSAAEVELFWSRVDRGAPDACWPWLAGRVSAGYGQFRDVYAHRIAALLAGLDIAGRSVCHRCDSPPCCNPAHLFVGTQTDNVHDAIAKGRARKPPVRRGAANNKTKLTPALVAEIRRAYEEMRRALPPGKTRAPQGFLERLTRQYGISKPSVGSIVRGEYWHGA